VAIKLKKDTFVRNLVKNHKLAGHIDKSIGEGEFNWHAEFKVKQGDDGFHPSSDCTPSVFNLFRSRTTDSKGISTGLSKAFQVGHFWHAYIQWIVVERLGYASWDEIEVRGQRRWADGPYGWATGSADIAPCHIPSAGDYLIDIKTMRAPDFKQQGLPSWCAEKYECQVNIYMDWFDLDEAIILCVCKDSPHEFKEFRFERNPELVEAIYSKWRLAGDCIQTGTVPDETYTIPLPTVGPRL